MARNLKIPKSVAGVKLPRKIRKKAKKALKIAKGPVVREFAAAAMGAAAAKRAAGAGKARDAGATLEIDGAAIGETLRNAKIDGSAIGEAFRAAAIDGFRCFLEGLEEGLRKA